MTKQEILDVVMKAENLVDFNPENFPPRPNWFGCGGTGTVFKVVEWGEDGKCDAQLWKEYTLKDLEENENWTMRKINASLFSSTEGKAYEFCMANLVQGRDDTVCNEPAKSVIPDDFLDDSDDEEEVIELDAGMTSVERQLMERAMELDDGPRDGMSLADVISEATVDTTPEVVDEEIPEPENTVIENGKIGPWEGTLRSKEAKLYDYLYWHGPVDASVLFEYCKHLGITKDVATVAEVDKLIKLLQGKGWDVRKYEDRVEIAYGVGEAVNTTTEDKYITQSSVMESVGEFLEGKLTSDVRYVEFQLEGNKSYDGNYYNILVSISAEEEK